MPFATILSNTSYTNPGRQHKLATKKLTTVVIDALEDIKARDIMLINVAKLTSVFDYIAVASADSSRQTRALANNVIDKVKEYGGWIYGTEGEQSGEWVLVDCGDVVVHIMQPAVREHYKLEELWGEGKLEFPKPAVARRKPATAKTSQKTRAGAKSKKTPTTKAKTSRTVTAGATAKVAKVKKSTAKGKVVTKKTATKSGTIARKKVTTDAVKKKVAKKPAARKPVTRRKKTE